MTNDLEMGLDEGQGLAGAQSPAGMVSQETVNKMVGAAKAKAQEATRQQVEAEFQKKLADLQAQKAQAQSRGNDTRDIDVESLYTQIQERMAKDMQAKQMESHMNHVSQMYVNKMAGGKEAYDDFDDVMADFDPNEFPQLVYLVAHMDNARDIVYELMKNPQKFAAMDYFARTSPKKAQTELRRIGASIAENQAILAQERAAKVNNPLDRMSPSLKTGSNGKMSVGELRNQPWLR